MLAAALILFACAITPVRADAPPAYYFWVLWGEARKGDTVAAYRLGRHYERRYWLAEREPEIRGNPADLVLAYALFRIAQRSDSLKALYGRNETEFRLKRILGEEMFELAIATLPEWMRPQYPPPSPGNKTSAREAIEDAGETAAGAKGG